MLYSLSHTIIVSIIVSWADFQEIEGMCLCSEDSENGNILDDKSQDDMFCEQIVQLTRIVRIRENEIQRLEDDIDVSL
jgi:hypothetical protein